MIEIERLYKNYGTVEALRGIDATINSGEFVALIGENGAGKTSLLSILMGLRQPTKGSIKITGYKPGEPEARAKTGAILQATDLPATLTVAESIELFRSYYPYPRGLDDIVAMTGLEKLLNRRYKALSGGQQRRMQFALALAGDPEILFLDEPTVGLDMDMRKAFWGILSTLKTEGKTIILTSHYLDEIDRLADRLIILAEGKIIADDQTSALKQSVEHKTITCATTIPQNTIENIDGVTDVETNGRLTSIITNNENKVLLTLLQGDPGLSDLLVEASGLESAIKKMTQPDHVPN
jgi:ABC-2 type transport system ATP-binding protein